MEWNNHWRLAGKHSFLSPSNYAWQGYDTDKVKKVWMNSKQKDRGTVLHDLASRMIKSGVRAADSSSALHNFINDSIDMNMSSEVLLYYSDNCFGTADAIKYDEKERKLYVFDLKTGVSPASMKQLYAYAALFCLEYDIKPHLCDFVLRIYQGVDVEEEVLIRKKDTAVIKNLMKKIVDLDNAVNEISSVMMDAF